MVLSTEWSQVEVIDLVNDGSGLGFGIVGGRSTGVVVKSILPGGIADRDGRLQSGDHILQIGDVQTRGLASEHVATILRQCGLQVRIVVARPVEPTSCDYRALGSDAPIVPTKTLTDPDELETLLMQNGYQNFETPTQSSSSNAADGNGEAVAEYEHHLRYDNKSKLDSMTLNIVETRSYPIITTNLDIDLDHFEYENETDDHFSEQQSESESETPESETILVHLEKNAYGLGITVAGYVWEREDLSGIFVKGISEGSAAHLSGQIHLNDRIVEVDSQSLRGVTNHEAVEMLRRTAKTVSLVLERYLRGPRYEHLQNALQADHVQQVEPTTTTTHHNHNQMLQHHHHHQSPSPPSPSVTTLSWFPVQTDNDNDTELLLFIEPEPESHTTIDSTTIFEPPDPDTVEVFVDPHFESGSVTPDLDMVVKRRWNSLIGGDHTEIVVAQLRKLRGLGISLEGTVDVEDGIELRPRHFIRSILPEGPVGRNGKLNTGDELLEVNGQKLLGRNHVDVVKILKELPETVRIVCARNRSDVSVSRVINTAQDRAGFAARNLLSGSLRTLLNVDEQQQQQEVMIDNNMLLTATASASDPSLNNTSSTATLADVDETSGAGGGLFLNHESIVLVHENGDGVGDSDAIPIENGLHSDEEDLELEKLNCKEGGGDELMADLNIMNNCTVMVMVVDEEVEEDNNVVDGQVNQVQIDGYDMNHEHKKEHEHEIESDLDGGGATHDAFKHQNGYNHNASVQSESDTEDVDLNCCKVATMEADNENGLEFEKEIIAVEKVFDEIENNYLRREDDHDNNKSRSGGGGGGGDVQQPTPPPPPSSSSSSSPLMQQQQHHHHYIHNSNNNNNNNSNKNTNSDESKSPKRSGTNNKMERRKSRSMEAVTYLAIWKTELEYIELFKGNKGLGFSILDYQDPLDPNGTVIVVRSLVPNGCAELDGRLRPGDRIMSVNTTSLRNVSLEEAVKALKGAPNQSHVRIGVSKPMPLLTNKQNDSTNSGGGGSSPLSIKDNYFIW